jgi:DNA-binding MarR family transcriptional regulator
VTRRLAESLSEIYDLDADAADRVLAAGLLLRVREIVLRGIDSNLSQFGTSHARFQVLSILANAPDGLQLNEIAARASVHPTTMTSTVERLVRDGLLERRSPPGNRRTILAVCTRKGRKLYHQAHAQLAAMEYGLAEVDIDVIRELLHSLDVVAENFESAENSEKAPAATRSPVAS